MNPSQRALPGRMTSVSIVAYRQRIPAGVIAVLLTSLWACSPSETDAVVEGLGSARESVEPGPLPGLSDVMRAKQPPACRGSGACDDGNPCTFNDKCVKGLCLGTAYSCNDGNACMTDICDGTGRCRFVANTAACDDGNACTTGDVCSAGRRSALLRRRQSVYERFLRSHRRLRSYRQYRPLRRRQRVHDGRRLLRGHLSRDAGRLLRELRAELHEWRR